MASFKVAIAHILKWEGGLARLKNDPGGITNFGISLKFLKSIDNRATVYDIENLKESEAKDLYYQYFWQPNNYEKLESQLIATKVFDLAVNCGATIANQCLQSAVNLVEHPPMPLLIADGIIGSKSISVINRSHFDAVYVVMKYNAITYYASLIAANIDLASFKRGWLNRCCDDPESKNTDEVENA